MKYAAFLSGINVGKRRVKMSILAETFERLGHQNVGTYIASGNIVFESTKRKKSLIEDTASRALQQTLGYDVNVFVRSADEVATIADTEHFRSDEACSAAINVGLMRNSLDAATAESLESVQTKQDSFRVIGSEFYWICNTKISESKVWDLPEIKQLALPKCTLRNISTIRKLVAKFFTG
ncbi:MAG: DUF1697 domain-containing protein [Planctomycetota bacterium]